MIYLNVWLTCKNKPEIDRLRGLLAEAADLSRQEEGCVRFEVYQSQNDAGKFLLHERWESQEALDRHRTARAYTTIYQPQVIPLVDRDGASLDLGQRVIAMILLIDNYDSFTYNLVQRLGEIDPSLEIEVHRNDQITLDEIERKRPSHLIISPGPCTPKEAGISCAAVSYFTGRLPVLGVCLGHQAIGQATGGEIVRAVQLMHGKVDRIHHDARGLFAGLPNPFEATRYHSLVIRPGTLSDEYEMTAWSEMADGGREIMAIQNKRFPVFGLQFHPESFLTLGGSDILRRFLEIRPLVAAMTQPSAADAAIGQHEAAAHRIPLQTLDTSAPAESD